MGVELGIELGIRKLKNMYIIKNNRMDGVEYMCQPIWSWASTQAS